MIVSLLPLLFLVKTTSIFAQLVLQPPIESTSLNVALTFSKNRSDFFHDFEAIGGAAILAQERIVKEQVLPGYNLNFSTYFDQCDELISASVVVDVMYTNHADAVIGPSSAMIAGVFGNLYNIPVVTWGSTTYSELLDIQRYPTMFVASVSSVSVGVAIHRMFKAYKWTQFALIYSTREATKKCSSMRTDMSQAFSAISDKSVDMAFQGDLNENTPDRMRGLLQQAQRYARVFVLCMDDMAKRDFMLAADDLNMTTSEYAYVFTDIQSLGFTVPTEDGQRFLWESDEGDFYDERLHRAFKRVFSLCDTPGLTPDFYNFSQEVFSKMDVAPISCGPGCVKNTTYASLYAYEMYEAVLVYVHVLNQTLTRQPGKYRDGRAMMANAELNFNGSLRTVHVGPDGHKSSVFYLIGLNSSELPHIYATITVDAYNSSMSVNEGSESGDMWYHYDGIIPLAVPICGFTGDNCPVGFWDSHGVWVSAGGGVIVLALLAIILAVAYVIRSRHLASERENKLWNIAYSTLDKPQINKRVENSMASVRTNASSRTANSVRDRRRFGFFTLHGEFVVALKIANRATINDQDKKDLRQIRAFSMENLNKFVGLCSDGPEILYIWKLCSRGSLADLINSTTFEMDFLFVFSLISDLTQGLEFIHNSNVKFHGKLTSETCLVDDRFQVKLAYFGLHKLLPETTDADKLWTAPEVLRDECTGSQAADIFGFSIICSELLTRKPAYAIGGKDAEEIVYKVKRGLHPLFRPEITIADSIEVGPGAVDMVEKCWSEDPGDRPTVLQIKEDLKLIQPNRQFNLMDHLLGALENHAGSLEEQVASRMLQLEEERKKSDVLLGRLLPKQVATLLRAGQTVPPEMYDSVSIFFSDVVSFTVLAGKSTPLQVVDLLNALYTTFDAIIEENEVYKVETIGDGYLCASGLPTRIGNQHARRMAEMALALIKSVGSFKVPHLPDEKINIRVGINCGSVVAGVVGITMPRYCLFGDTVNTASRMESNGKPGRVHLSSSANDMLTKVVGGYVTERRGAVIVKGKGVMETYWLLGKQGDVPIGKITEKEPGLYTAFKAEQEVFP